MCWMQKCITIAFDNALPSTMWHVEMGHSSQKCYSLAEWAHTTYLCMF